MEQENNNNKDKYYLKPITIFSIILIVSLLFFYLLTSNKIEKTYSENNNIDEENDIPAFEETKTETLYLIKEFNGKIGIFENDALIYTLDVYIFTLPKKDQKLLSEGISVSSKEELYKIIEEYY